MKQDKYEACAKNTSLKILQLILPQKADRIKECFDDFFSDGDFPEVQAILRKHFPPVSEEGIEEIADQWWKDHTDWLKDEFRMGHPKDIVKAALRKLAGKGGE